jgi:hypothetical protein
MVTGYHVYGSIWTAGVGEKVRRYKDIVSSCSGASRLAIASGIQCYRARE